jgi:TRAP-type uncharacterized transport system fused permease subunit
MGQSHSYENDRCSASQGILCISRNLENHDVCMRACIWSLFQPVIFSSHPPCLAEVQHHMTHLRLVLSKSFLSYKFSYQIVIWIALECHKHRASPPPLSDHPNHIVYDYVTVHGARKSYHPSCPWRTMKLLIALVALSILLPFFLDVNFHRSILYSDTLIVFFP